MLSHVEDRNIINFRLKLSQPNVNVITFLEPSRPSTLPNVPKESLTPFQFWFANESWQDNWGKLENAVTQHFNDKAAAIIQRCCNLVELFTELTGDTAPFVSLRTITPEYFENSEASVSAGWHRDATILTLQDTIMGEPLEYTHDENVKREYFESRQIQPFATSDDNVLNDVDAVKKVPQGQVAILKGEMRSDESDQGTLEFLSNFIDVTQIPDFNRGRGLIHRGHKDTENGRLVLTISTHKVPAWMPL